MSEILFHYQRVNVTSWAYLSSLLMIALFFKFNRFWSVRNIDLFGLILLAPGLLLVQHALDNPGDPNTPAIEQMGYAWLFVVGGCLLIRMLLDSTMVRRPMLEPNLSVGGLAFLGVSMFLFLMANVLNGSPGEQGVHGAEAASELTQLQSSGSADESFAQFGPGLPLIFVIPRISTSASANVLLNDDARNRELAAPMARDRYINEVTAKVVSILSHLFIVLGIIAIGAWHFENIRMGFAAALLYLMLPYTALWTGHIFYSLPAALLVWAVAAYRRPTMSGVLMGLAISVIYYPLYLLPLWTSFYWRRGRRRFIAGVLLSVAVVVASLAFTSGDLAEFWAQIRAVFGFRMPAFDDDHLGGAWTYWDKMYRIPILAAFLCMAFGLAFWPAQKNLGALISCSAAVMLGTQYWHPTSSGLAMAWYLPLALLTVFRPNLEDCFAEAVVTPGRVATTAKAGAPAIPDGGDAE